MCYGCSKRWPRDVLVKDIDERCVAIDNSGKFCPEAPKGKPVESPKDDQPVPRCIEP